MLTSTAAWPEIIFFDSTYKLILHSLVLILFLVEDGNFSTEVSAVAIVRREDQARIDWVLQCFKEHHNDAIANIKYFTCDKNATQRISVDKFFPNASLLICLFHTLQIFKREIRQMNISTQEKESCLKTLEKIAYAENDDKYEYFFNVIKKEFPEDALQYFLKNWHNIKNQWTCYEQVKCNFNNRTNNRSESLNQKLKATMNKMNSLLEAVKSFFVWKNFHDDANKRKITKNFGSELPI